MCLRILVDFIALRIYNDCIVKLTNGVYGLIAQEVKANDTTELQRKVHLLLVAGWIPTAFVISDPFFKYVQVMEKE